MEGSSPIQIRLNGAPAAVDAGTSLAALLISLGKNSLAVAIERNGEIVRRARFGETLLESGDSLEIVQFVQGG